MSEAVKQPKTTLKSVIGLILISVLFALFIIEVATRLNPRLIPPVIRIYFVDENYQKWGMVGDKDLGYKYAPNLVNFPTPFDDDEAKKNSYPVSTVSLGFLDVGFRDDGIDGEPFAVVVGDSFASCAGVKMEECWVEVLEQRNGKDFANLGVISYGPQQSLRMLTKYGAPLNPKLVVWAFFANDPDDAWRFAHFGKGEAKVGKFWENPVRSWLVQNSATYMVLTFFWYNRRFFHNLARADGETLPLESNLVWWQTATDPTNPTAQQGLELTEQSLLEAKKLLRVHNPTEFVVVIIPTREQIYYNDSLLQAQLDAQNYKLVDFGQKNSITIIDLTAAVRERITDEPFLYFEHDLHLNSRGNKVIAELIEQELAEILEPAGE